MPKNDFSDLKSLFKYIESQSAKSLKSDVAPTARQEMSETIQEVTFSQYDPSQYVRRELRGEKGLSSIENIQVELVDDHTISIENVTTGDDDDYGRPIDEIMVTGTGYTWERSRIYKNQPYPRDFYQDTADRLKANGKHIEALKKGMLKRGLNVK
ncbi:hypothetical protein [Paenibacillus sp. NAIST15-1]|uniref:hypothetical protein n=1 Tax=Paenibacillus sp. NAIST15-1 TaxID=1605994 RepID=UPI00086F572F|nr:hypothetical protein [Paenibacillus sp. NAIST15-1]GAV11285.1 conserved domain protein [Paenibacillus sp. NAIST15-1]